MSPPRPVAFQLVDFPEHAAAVADMLLGFATLEFLMTELLAQALGGRDKLYTAARILYRLRGANDRLNVADALLAPHMEETGLRGPYSQFLGAMRHCRTIRNQYAHCGWNDEGGHLWFMDLQAAGHNTQIYSNRIDLSLLKEQQAYFDYAMQLLSHLVGETRFQDEGDATFRQQCPKSRAKPRLYSHPD